MDGDPFSYIQGGLRDLREGFHEGVKMRWMSEDRKAAQEQKMRMMEANKKFAAAVRAKPGIWRDANAVAALAEGGYDALGLLKMTHDEFAPPDPLHSQQAKLMREMPDMLNAMVQNPEDMAAKVKYNTSLAMLGELQLKEDIHGNWSNPIIEALNPSAGNALSESANKIFKKSFGYEPDKQVANFDNFMDNKAMATGLLREEAGMDKGERIVYNKMLQKISSLAGEDFDKMVKNRTVPISIFDKEGNFQSETEYNIDDYPELSKLVQRRAKSNIMGENLVKSGAVDPEWAKEVQLAKSQDKMKKSGEIFDMDKMSRAMGIPEGGVVERLKESPHLKKRIIGNVVEGIGEVAELASKAPLAGAGVAYAGTKKMLSAEYTKRMEEARAEEEEYRAKKLRTVRK